LPKKINTKKDKHNQTWICGPFLQSSTHLLYCTQYCTTKFGYFFGVFGFEKKAAKASIKESHHLFYITSNSWLDDSFLYGRFKLQMQKKKTFP
jgi:hypothetical protein